MDVEISSLEIYCEKIRDLFQETELSHNADDKSRKDPQANKARSLQRTVVNTPSKANP